MKIKAKGFTLIELLVVISIIGILAALASFSFTGTQKQAKDTERKSDLNQYRSMLESFANANGGLYPSRLSPNRMSTTICQTDMGFEESQCAEDPKYEIDNSYQVYAYSGGAGTGFGSITATKYVIWAQLESSENYWVVCSDGRSGTKLISAWGSGPYSGECPL